MARRPVLTSYPHLHHILKNDPVANQQFNAVLNEVNASLLSSSGGEVESDLRRAQASLAELREDVVDLRAFAKKAKTLLRKFSEVLESQVQLTPYSDDITEGKEYIIKFSAVQVRKVLALHWEVVAHRTEDVIAGRPVDPEDEEQ